MPASAPPPTGRPVVLAADDDPAVRRFLQAALDGWGVPVLMASDGGEAVDLYQAHRAEVGLVLLDVQMPRLDGPAAMAGLQALDPGVRCWFLTANPHPYTESELVELGATGVLRKPIRLRALKTLVGGSLTAGGPPASAGG